MRGVPKVANHPGEMTRLKPTSATRAPLPAVRFMTGYEFHPDALADLDEIWEYQAGEVRLEPGTTKNQGDFSGLTSIQKLEDKCGDCRVANACHSVLHSLFKSSSSIRYA